MVKKPPPWHVERGMRLNRRTVALLGVLAAATAVGLPVTASRAASPPPVTVSGKAFPAEWPDGALHSCTFRIGFQGFTAGQQAGVVFRAVPPSVPTSGDNVVLHDTFALPGESHTATYDLRVPLAQRFRAGSLAGWDVELRIDVAGPVGTDFGADAAFIRSQRLHRAAPADHSDNGDDSTALPAGRLPAGSSGRGAEGLTG